MTTLRSDNLTILGAPLGGENPLPFFRSPQHDLPVRALPGMPSEKLAGFGVEAGFRVLPYRMQDTYGRARQPLSFKTLVLENEYLAATFLPELGGRLYSLVHKPQGRELLACNPVFQPANLAFATPGSRAALSGISANLGTPSAPVHRCLPELFAANMASRACGCMSLNAAKGYSGRSTATCRPARRCCSPTCVL